MSLIIGTFLSGVLTVLAPCIFPLLPIILKTTAESDNRLYYKKTFVVIGSLAISIIVFSLLLKASTILLGVPQAVWQFVSGGIVLLIGLTYLLPELYARAVLKLGLNRVVSLISKPDPNRSRDRSDVILGLSLGPIFNSCSPTYALIVAVLLPTSFLSGLGYLLSYVVGLGLSLFIIAWLGRRATSLLGWAVNEHGVFKRVLGIIFVAIGLAIIFGLDRSLQTFVLDRGWYDWVKSIDQRFTW